MCAIISLRQLFLSWSSIPSVPAYPSFLHALCVRSGTRDQSFPASWEIWQKEDAIIILLCAIVNIIFPKFIPII